MVNIKIFFFFALLQLPFVHAEGLKDTLSKVGEILNGKPGIPSSDEVNKEVDRLLRVPLIPQCRINEEKVKERVEEILAVEDLSSGNDDEVHCQVVSGEKFKEVLIEGKKYKVPYDLSLEDFKSNCLSQVSEIEMDLDNKLSLNSNNSFESFSGSVKTTRMIETLRRNVNKCITSRNKFVCQKNPPKDRKPENKPTGFCLKYVKTAVLAGGFTETYPPGVAAKDSGTNWKRMGFKNLLDDPEHKNMTPYTAPVGAILVYAGGKYGHVEVKTAENEYISDYMGEKPIYDELKIPRRIIGIYAQ